MRFIVPLLLLVSHCQCQKNFTFNYEATDGNNQVLKGTNVAEILDYPTESDLPHYLELLRNYVKVYCVIRTLSPRKGDFDTILFGCFFVAYAHIKIGLKSNQERIPAHVVNNVTEILEYIGSNCLVNISLFFGVPGYEVIESDVLERMENHQPLKVKVSRPTPESLKEFQLIQKMYISAVYDFITGVPHPTESDKCIASIRPKKNAENEVLPICTINEHCYYMLINGDNFGYSLTHRLLWLIAARVWRGCALLSPLADKQLAAKLCREIAVESQLLVESGIAFRSVLMDLYLEQVAFCYFDGHDSFIQRSWLAKASQQHKIDEIHSVYNLSRNYNIEHMNALSVVVYSSAIRVILTKSFSSNNANSNK